MSFCGRILMSNTRASRARESSLVPRPRILAHTRWNAMIGLYILQKDYFIFFHISLLWKYIYSSTFNLCWMIFLSSTFSICGRIDITFPHLIFVNICGRLCLVIHLLHLWKNTWCSSTFLVHESILILPRLMFVEDYV